MKRISSDTKDKDYLRGFRTGKVAQRQKYSEQVLYYWGGAIKVYVYFIRRKMYTKNVYFISQISTLKMGFRAVYFISPPPPP